MLVSLDDPAYGMARHLELALGQTPHLAYHVAAALLARVLGVELGHRLLLTAVLAGTPWALRALLRAVGGDERVSLLSVGLTYGVHLILGFLPFLAAVPLMLGALAWAAGLAERPRWRAALGLSALLVLTYHVHVVPWSVAVVGVGLVLLVPGPSGPERPGWRVRAPMLLAAAAPSVGIAAAWVYRSASGRAALGVLGRAAAIAADPSPGAPAPASLATTFVDVFAGDVDEALFYLAVVLAWGGTLVAAGDGAKAGRTRPWLVALTVACVVAYLLLPQGHGWIWGIHARFAWLAAWLALALARLPAGRSGRVLTAVAGALAAGHVLLAGVLFVRFDREEAVGLDEAIAAIPRAERVVGLVYRPTSRNVRFAPFLHAVAWYQARRGGVVMFSFADFPSWTHRFRDSDRPPRLPSRWEWEPQRVFVAEDLAWYRYLLVRGGPGPVASLPALYRQVHRGGAWSVWRRTGASRPRSGGGQGDHEAGTAEHARGQRDGATDPVERGGDPGQAEASRRAAP